MTDKKIILVISSRSPGTGVVRFLNGFIAGDNVRISLCILEESSDLELNYDGLLDEISSICISKSIPLRIRRLRSDADLVLRSMANFADLLVFEKSVLQVLALGHEFVRSSCATIAIPSDFSSITNILLITDGSSGSVQGIKQFFQIFPRLSGDLDVNLLSVSAGMGGLSSEQEIMLLDYLKQYSKNVGILKVEEPLTHKLLKPIRYDNSTIVVSTMRFLLSRYGEDEVFKPFFDNQTTLFVPAEIS